MLIRISLINEVLKSEDIQLPVCTEVHMTKFIRRRVNQMKCEVSSRPVLHTFIADTSLSLPLPLYLA